MKVYAKVVKNNNSGLILPHSMNIANALKGFSDFGAEIIPYYSLDEIYDVVKNEDIVLDYIEQCNLIFKKITGKIPHVDDYPKCLHKYMGRNIWYDTIDSISSDEKKWSAGWFVKPIKTKRFTGKVISSITNLIGCGNSEEDYEVICTEAISFKREWRCFIYYDKIIDIRPYKGDYHYVYDPNVLDCIMKDFITWEDRPVACSIDIGVTEEGKTLLIECNDCYALGAYGLVDYNYAKMISARWAQIIGRDDEYDFRLYENIK